MCVSGGRRPGDPDLLTVKAARLIREAEVVVFDRLVSKKIQTLIPPGATRIFAGKEPGRHPLRQEEINDLPIRLAWSPSLTFGECLVAYLFFSLSKSHRVTPIGIANLTTQFA